MMKRQEERGNSSTLKPSDKYSSGRGGEEMIEEEEEGKDRWRRL